MSIKSIRFDSPTPIRSQLKALLVQEIESGSFKRGGRIPSERELAEKYGISRASVRESITELINAGVLFRTVGRGTFVAAEERSMRGNGQTGGQNGSDILNVGFVISESIFHFVQTGYDKIFAGVQESCAAEGWRLLFKTVGDNADQAFVQGLRASPQTAFDGCIVVGGLARHIVDALYDKGIPTVLVDFLISDTARDTIAVTIDYDAGARMAVRHVYELGHRAIGYIGFSGNDKYRGYWRSLEELGLRYEPQFVELLQLLDLQPGILAGFQAMQRMLRADRLPTALLVTNDFVAMGVMERLSMAGIRIPEQISIIGFDDLGVKTSPPLTTVRVDLPQVGRLAAGALARIMQQQLVEVEHTVVPVELVVRATTAPAPADAVPSIL